MKSPSSAITAGDGCAAKNEEVTSSIEQKTEVSSSSHTMSNGLHDYRFMKNGKPRPSAVRDFPRNIVPANHISDVVLVSKEEQEHVLLSSFNENKEQKQIKEGLVVPAAEKRAESNADVDICKEEKEPSKKLRAEGKKLMLLSKKPQEESKKQGVASPNTAKPFKEKDASTEKTQKTPTKLGDKKSNAISSTVSDELEAEPNKGKGASAEKTPKTPTKAGKSIQKKASTNALTESDASPQEAEAKANKGKDVSTEKAQKTPLKVGKSVERKPSGIASTVSENSVKEAEGETKEKKGVRIEKIQKMPTKLGKSVEKKANDIAPTVPDASKGAEQEVVSASHGEIEAMDIDKDAGKELRVEIEKGIQKEDKSQEKAKGETIKKQLPVKRKSGIRDLPEIANQTKEKVAMESVQDHAAQDLGIEESVQEKPAADNAKLNSNGKKKRPLEEPDPSDRSKKVRKSKPSDTAKTAKESSSGTQAPVETPKAKKPTKKASTPSDSGKKVRRSAGKLPKPSTVTDVGDSRKLLLESLRLFDAVRRMYLQDEEKNGKQGKGNRADLQAATCLKDKNAGRLVEKAPGSFPGIIVGDVFLLRTELSFARVHGPIQAGIEYLTAKESEYNTPVAISIVSNVGQDGEDNGEELIYTGQGGRSADKQQIADQKLERGNLALDGCTKHNVPVRMFRGVKDANSPSGKIYVYDGLYKVEDTFTEKGSGGFDEYKFRLKRIPDQPELGSEILKLASDLKIQSPSSRKNIVVADISKGKESQAICVENTVDDDKGPAPFEYSTKVIYPDDMENLEASVGCTCKGACSPSSSCSCFSKNGDELPYLNGGYLVRQKDFIFECGSKCSCSSSCRNRTTEKGLKFRLDVFKTVDRGWGVRSLDMIPAGSFVCEYIGKLVADEEEIKDVSDREHLLFTRRLPDTTPRWGDVSSIIPERSSSTVRPDVGNPDLIIDASSFGNVARFINHSCSPNLLIQKVLSQHQDVRYPHYKLFALENIPPLRELTFDYGHPSDQELVSEDLTMDCLCGSSNCRGKLYL